VEGMDIDFIEVELSSLCNAACPGCARTNMLEKEISFPQQHLDTDILYHALESIYHPFLKVKLCGVLGEPLMHPQVFEVCEYFNKRQIFVNVSTNAGLRSRSYWHKLGELSAQFQLLHMQFCIDGLSDTNAIYRVNTRFDKIINNLKAYTQAGGIGTWVMIDFQHNHHQIEQARLIAHELGLGFSVRRAVRNIPFKSKKAAHSKNTIVQGSSHQQEKEYLVVKKALTQDNQSQKPVRLTGDQIHCKFVHEKEIFISADARVWPCCFLWDEFVSPKKSDHTRVHPYIANSKWNCLQHNSLKNILSSHAFQLLNQFWESDHPDFLKRCHKSCGNKGGFRNQFSSR
jgi:MoaA/NifB/PqqE/SkfB family radical SAM enzyme